MLLCYNCNTGWHLVCLGPPLATVPTGRWECPLCSQRPSTPPPSLQLLNNPSPILNPICKCITRQILKLIHTPGCAQTQPLHEHPNWCEKKSAQPQLPSPHEITTVGFSFKNCYSSSGGSASNSACDLGGSTQTQPRRERPNSAQLISRKAMAGAPKLSPANYIQNKVGALLYSGLIGSA